MANDFPAAGRWTGGCRHDAKIDRHLNLTQVARPEYKQTIDKSKYMYINIFKPSFEKGKPMQKPTREDAVNTGQVCACFNLRKTARAVTAMYESIMKPCGLKGTQFSMLMVVRAVEPATINDVAAHLAMDRTTLTRNLKPLTRQGLVASVPGEDRRKRFISLTPEGHSALETAYPLWQKAQEKMKRELGTERLHGLLAMLEITAGIPER